jgi:hypothetical protein
MNIMVMLPVMPLHPIFAKRTDSSCVEASDSNRIVSIQTNVKIVSQNRARALAVSEYRWTNTTVKKLMTVLKSKTVR